MSRVKDLRNHGESPHDPRHDYDAMTEDILAFIDHHGLKEPTLIGHSMYASQDCWKPYSRLILLQGSQDGHVGCPPLPRDCGEDCRG